MLQAVLLVMLASVVQADVSGRITEQWWGGFKFEFTLAEASAVDHWCFNIQLSGTIDSIQCDWAATATQVSGGEYQLCNIPSDGHIDGGSSFSNLCVVTCGQTCSGNGPYAYTLTLGDGSGSSGTQAPTDAPTDAPEQTLAPGETPAPGHSGGSNGGHGGGGTVPTDGGRGTKNYADALAKAILFYAAQRSGRLPPDNPISWRHDSAMGDCVVGGWYDAGDHVKFGLPFGATAHVLLWGLYKFKDGYQAANQLDRAYDMVKWATDYMLGAYNSGTHELVAQIGDGNADHSYWGSPEGMTMGRPCFKVGPGKPAAELYGEWAASLAAASLVFADKGDAAYAARCLEAAKSMYEFGKANPGTYGNSIPGIAQFYGSTGYKDEMCLGAMWLYRATGQANYLSDAKGFHQSDQAWALSWDDKKVACQLLLYEDTKENSYKSEVQGMLRDWLPGGSVAYTPCGLAWRDKWGSNRYAGNSAFVALAAADDGINPGEYTRWAVEQLNFLLGDNHQQGGCFSFEIGYGNNYPRHPHHRGASTAGQVLNGALVGGPDSPGGSYQDDQGNYVTNEVAIDYNSGFTSALAGVEHFIHQGGIPTTHNKCACG